MTKRVSGNNRPLKLSSIDVKKAHLCSEVLRELYVEPPPEAKRNTGHCLAVATSQIRHAWRSSCVGKNGRER